MNTVATVTPVTPMEHVRAFKALSHIVKFQDDDRPVLNTVKGLSETETIQFGYQLAGEGRSLQARGSFVIASRLMILDKSAQKSYRKRIREYILDCGEPPKRVDAFLSEVNAAIVCLENPEINSSVFAVAQVMKPLKDKELRPKVMLLLKNKASQSDCKKFTQSLKSPPETPEQKKAREAKEAAKTAHAKSAEGRIESYVASLRDAIRHWDLCIDAKASSFQIQKASVSEFVTLAKSYRLELIALETATEVKLRIK